MNCALSSRWRATAVFPARRLGLSQPTVGRHIDALEAALGSALFARSPRGLTPTPAALALAPHAEAMAAAAAALARTASGEAAADRGEPDDGTRYYEHWLAALERLVTGRGLMDQDALLARKEAWADAIAADMASVFDNAPDGFLDAKIGRRLRDEIYAQSNSRDITVSVEKFLGREQSIEPFLKKKLGIQ